MSSVSSVTSGTTPLTLSKNSNVMGKDDFLRLLVTQLQNQDPLNPSDATEFTAQLAQFSSLEQLFAVNSTLGKMAEANGDMERLSALNLIGKEVTATGENFRLGQGEVQLGYKLESPAAAVSLFVLDSSGRTVASLSDGNKAEGEYFVSWSGRDSAGNAMPPGNYTLAIKAVDAEEKAVTASPLVRGTVTGVDLEPSGSVLVSTAGDFALKDVASVREI